MKLKWKENDIYLVIEVSEEGEVFLLHLSSLPYKKEVKEASKKKYRLVEIHETGMNQNDHHGCKYTGSCPGYLLKYKEHQEYRNNNGLKIELTQTYKGLDVRSHIQFFDGISVIQSWTEVINGSELEHPIEYVSSLTLTGLNKESTLPRDQGAAIHIPHSTWCGEAQWKSYTPNQIGFNVVNDFSVKRIELSSKGSWGTSEFLPMGSYENFEMGTTYTWQIETSASWHWEISDIVETLYLHIYGPTYQDGAFLKILKPQEAFVTVPCALSVVNGDFEKSIRELTKYRRIIRRDQDDNRHPKVIFNDYMNCLTGDPTTEKLLPLIEAAAKAHCDIFCIDAGWYDDGPWWNGVGEWLPAKKRFPNGIEEPIRYIREKGMIPGLWLELEVMGINCPMVKKVPKDWFFQRNGRPIIDEGRYQLDFRNPEVIAHANSVINRIVEEYGVGYIKIDYNINSGLGTEVEADSPGDGLLQHTRAYLNWLDQVFERYPELIIENCSSGGMRMEYSHLKRHSIQSVTDQTDYLLMAAIAANCVTAVTPEQAGIWSYPLGDGDEEEVVFNMVNAILLRIHQSGHLAEISRERFDLVKEGIDYHKKINHNLKDGLPFWPLGLASFSDPVLCFGIECQETSYLAVWNVSDEDRDICIPLKRLLGDSKMQAQCSYPVHLKTSYHWNDDIKELNVRLKQKIARIFELTHI